MSNEQQGKTGINYTTGGEEKCTSSPQLILSKINDYTSTIKSDSNTQNYSFETLEQQTSFYNTWADYWRYVIGVDAIPADTRNKTIQILWKQYQNNPISVWQHNEWKKKGAFNGGIAIILGKVWHREDKKGLYFVLVDADKAKAIDELCTRDGEKITLQKMAEKFIVEQHRDCLDRAHIYVYSPIPFPQKSADSVLGLEVKGSGEHGIAFCSPSTHRDGMPYENHGYLRACCA